MWWPKPVRLPSLVTTSPPGTPPELSGNLGQSLDLGIDKTELADFRSGGRFSLGYWLNPERTFGLEGNFMPTGTQKQGYFVTSQEMPILARPFYNTADETGDALLVAHPDYLSGYVGVYAENEFWGAEALLRLALQQYESFRLEGLCGYRFAHLGDSLVIDQSSEWTADQGFIAAGTTMRLIDEFATTNDFHGGTLGLVAQLHRPRWSLELMGKLSLGNTSSKIRINGSTTTKVPGEGSVTADGGLLALGSNVGEYRRSSFSLIPEFGVTLGYHITAGLQATLGYSFLYWTDVIRAGDQIDLAVNPSQFTEGSLVGPARPGVLSKKIDFWAQGLNFGLEYRF